MSIINHKFQVKQYQIPTCQPLPKNTWLQIKHLFSFIFLCLSLAFRSILYWLIAYFELNDVWFTCEKQRRVCILIRVCILKPLIKWFETEILTTEGSHTTINWLIFKNETCFALRRSTKYQTCSNLYFFSTTFQWSALLALSSAR